jgi:hypothetical protein
MKSMLPLERFHHVVSTFLPSGDVAFNRQALLATLDIEAMTVACKALASLLPTDDNLLLLGVNEPVLCLSIANALSWWAIWI